ncbi:hypothetical protein BPNSA17_11780 [Bordetella petrii]
MMGGSVAPAAGQVAEQVSGTLGGPEGVWHPKGVRHLTGKEVGRLAARLPGNPEMPKRPGRPV